MSIKTVTDLAIKAALLTGLCECATDEAICFFATKHTLQSNDLIILFVLTGLAPATLKNLTKDKPDLLVTNI